MFKYQKGYIFNGHTFVVNKEDIHNASDDMFVEGTALLPAPDVVTNADRIRAMSDDQLAEFLFLSPEMEFDVCRFCEYGNPTPQDDRGQCLNSKGCYANAEAEAFKKWLQQPAEGE